MTKSNATRRALLVSALATVMCLAMLIGTTFAWFTDTASTGLNKIQAGNLDVKLSYKDENGNFKEVDTNTNIFKEGALWEPGHVEYAVLKVENAGTLALKYKFGINIVSETGSVNVDGDNFKLSDYIKFAVVDDDLTSNNRAELVEAAEKAGAETLKNYSTTGELPEKNDSDVVTLVVWMPENVGNAANYKIGAAVPEINMGINVVATQLDYEKDSFGDDYDAGLDYPETYSVATASELTAAIKAAKAIDTVKLTSDITADKVRISKAVTIDLNGFTLTGQECYTLVLNSNADVTVMDSSEAQTGKITNSYSKTATAYTIYMTKYSNMTFTLLSGTIESNEKARSYAISNENKVNCTVNIKGGKVAVQENDEKSYAISAGNGMTLNISGGEIIGGAYGISVYTGSVTTITGGKISAKSVESHGSEDYNVSYGLFAKGNAKVTIGSLSEKATPTVEGIKMEFNGNGIPEISLVKGDITNSVYCTEPNYKLSELKLDIKAGAPVTFSNDTANLFLNDGLKMTKTGTVWTVVTE